MLVKTLQFIPIIVFGLVFTFCSKNDDNDFSLCGDQVIVSAVEYVSAPDDLLTIISAEITGDCLKIKYSSSGCDGSTWELKLIDSGMILESNPPQRNLRLSMKNDELCDAYFEKEISFDISNLQVSGNQVLLNLTNSGDQLTYNY